MSEVGGPLAEVREHGRLDRLHSFRLFGVVGDAVFRAVGCVTKSVRLLLSPRRARAAIVLLFTFFLPRRARRRRRLVAGVLFRLAFAQLLTRPALLVANFDALFTRCGAVVWLFGV